MIDLDPIGEEIHVFGPCYFDSAEERWSYSRGDLSLVALVSSVLGFLLGAVAVAVAL